MRMAATAAVYNRLHNTSVGVVGGGLSTGPAGGVGGGGLGHHHQLARSLERILEEAHLSGELILTNRKLKDFPKTGTKFNLHDTVIADLSRNRFCELPEEITTFSFLETLLLYHNTIRSIPESVKHLTSLTYLDLRSNQLSSMPREICFLPLQVLLVSNNRLTALPDELGRMDRLTDLDASYNQLTTLPARIGELRSLRSFSLRSNQLMYLPRELTCLTLVSLDVSNNRISSLPLEIRQMSTLVEINLENNPMTSPPASLCVRGLVHVFKYLETQATKEEKGSRAGGNYDGYTTLRRAPRNNSNGNVLETHRVARHHVDSGYSTCDGIDKRWSHDMPLKSKNESPKRMTPTTPPLPKASLLNADLMDASLTSSTSTIVDESISVTAAVVKPLNMESQSTSDLSCSPIKRKEESNLMHLQQQHLNYAHNNSSSSSGSTPDLDDGITMVDHNPQQQLNGKIDDKVNKNLGNIQTYREYKEALKQQRSQEVYKLKEQKHVYDVSETPSPQPSEDMEIRLNGNAQSAPVPKSIMKNSANNANATLNGSSVSVSGVGNIVVSSNGCIEETVVIPKKPIQKVIPSRNTELMSSTKHAANDVLSTVTTNGDCIGYVKPSSPMKTLNGGSVVSGGNGLTGLGVGILTNNNKFTTTTMTTTTTSTTPGSMKSPVGNNSNKIITGKAHRTVTWNHDIPPEKLSFTMRREFDRQREEIELMTQLRSIIETRLKMTLPDDIASALTDGVILCHLANYVRPRSVASIHVPSPGVSKLTMARCRRNVDNFLEACRKIGVDENLICCAADVLEGKGAVQVAITVGELFRIHGNGANIQNSSKSPTRATRATLTPSPIV
ncbi:leucine-rich repeat and calponin homology domain-containing protein isoform X2 [Calliphora vicina]|uniref:leucine-rich repeat and calponin homology domain-containing protein isoform X2 n=1 Tax=Calliphora vicina TaxID=7373 RepID=UPI00325A92FC